MAADGRRPSLEGAFLLLAAGIGAIAGAAALVDNSFLTHLATGRIIWDGGGVPRADPYTFTAAGESWMAQSWLASVLYGGLDRIGGLGALRLLMAATTAALGALTWTLTRPASPLTGRLLVFVPALVAGLDTWAERPLLLGLVALAAALLAAEERLDPRWLLPIGWVWVNVHGSWPLGLVALGCLAGGRLLDRSRDRPELRAGAWLAAGFLLAAVNPYGPRLLAFPVLLLGRREALSGIVEWGPMTFDSLGQWAFVALVLVGAIGLWRRPSWRAGVPLVVFATLAVTGLRNVPVAALVLLPGAARGMEGVGTIAFDRRSALARPVAILGGVLLGLGLVTIATTDDFADEAYPVEAARWLEDNGLGADQHRIVAREFVGNWFEAVHGPTQLVFMDDRMEVIPEDVVVDHRRLLRGDAAWEEILARYEPAAVLWQVDSPLADELETDPDWTVAYRDDEWLVAVPGDP